MDEHRQARPPRHQPREYVYSLIYLILPLFTRSSDILLTRDPLATSLPTTAQPLLQLTDSGLARFIDSAQPLLQTHCGSKSYEFKWE